uniref:Uncharacterized protein n=1 Tax=Clastoptera arizonana TaxID=38151 RepID=A0A1B6E6V4_9HEMI
MAVTSIGLILLLTLSSVVTEKEWRVVKLLGEFYHRLPYIGFRITGEVLYHLGIEENLTEEHILSYRRGCEKYITTLRNILKLFESNNVKKTNSLYVIIKNIILGVSMVQDISLKDPPKVIIRRLESAREYIHALSKYFWDMEEYIDDDTPSAEYAPLKTNRQKPGLTPEQEDFFA